MTSAVLGPTMASHGNSFTPSCARRPGVETKVRDQGFVAPTLLVEVRTVLPLGFPRFVFAGCWAARRAESSAATFGVHHGDGCRLPSARVPEGPSREIWNRTEARGVVRWASTALPDPVFTLRERERVAALA
jgi:hypothetical protein